MKHVLHLDPHDNVAICIIPEGLSKGMQIDCPKTGGKITLLSDIPRGHKLALENIQLGYKILKWNSVIGVTTSNVLCGEHVHTHNCRMPSPEEFSSNVKKGSAHDLTSLEKQVPTTFLGFERASGRFGIRNYLIVAATVNCSATVVKAICQHFKTQDLSQYKIDGVIPLTHQTGCAQAIGGLNFNTLNRTLAGWVYHPNVVGALLVGLGCEGTTPDSVLAHAKKMNLKTDATIETMSIQDLGGTSSAINSGISRVQKILESLPKFERKEVSVSKLILALNCGGSDSFSSLTANPALGVTTDLLTHLEGTSVLAEIPECHGAEPILESRSSSEKTTADLRAIFEWWHEYAKKQNVSLNNNLAPGNIAGGLTTIIEKSLGAVSKAGTATLTSVVDYSYPITQNGFVLMNTPGFDPVSVTGLVAGGCQLVAFTTGRGSTYGASIAPTIKISSNSELFRKMSGDMDFNAGEALENKSIQELGVELFKFIVSVASGNKTKSELLGLGWEEFTPWPIGETL